MSALDEPIISVPIDRRDLISQQRPASICQQTVRRLGMDKGITGERKTISFETPGPRDPVEAA